MQRAFSIFAFLMVLHACLLPSLMHARDKKPDRPKEVVVNDALTTADVKDKVRTGMYCKTYTIKMTEGKTYQLDMKSGDMDSYLRLENSDGAQVGADDDSGGFPNARILYRAPRTGDYTIICTTYAAGATGRFTLIVQDTPGGPIPKQEDKKDK